MATHTPQGTTGPKPELPSCNYPQAASTDLGYRPPTACTAAGITYRQLDYWARTGLVEPSLRSANGSGTARLYTFRDVVTLRVVRCLLDTGVSLQNIRQAIAALDEQPTADLASLTLLSDGASVYMLHTTEQVAELLQGGSAVYGIALAHVVADVTDRLSEVHAERAAGAETPALQVVS